MPGELPPAQLIAALLLTGMLAGQFAHLWATQARRIAGLYTHQRQRFDEFARNYQLLKVSHDGLEERSAAARGNLRTAIDHPAGRAAARARAPSRPCRPGPPSCSRCSRPSGTCRPPPCCR